MDTLNHHNLHIAADATTLFSAAARDFQQRAQAAVAEKNIFHVVLSGGNTPKRFFDCLTAEPYRSNIPWDKIHFFFGDERYVPAEDERSNAHMAQQYLFTKVPVSPDYIHIIPTAGHDPDADAQSYSETIRQTLALTSQQWPRFDLVYLGLGSDAHTASLMPNTELVAHYADLATPPHQQITAALWVEALNMYRITLTPPAINPAYGIRFLVEGAGKASAVWQIIQGPHNPIEYPAQLIQASEGNVVWFLDPAASDQLKL